MTVHLLRHSCQWMLLLVLILGFAGLAGKGAQLVRGQTSEDPSDLARQAFTQLAGIYRSDGNAPELVAKLNVALELIQEARSRKLDGDEAGALALEEKARAAISEVLSEIPVAQERAQRESTQRTLTVLLSVPVVVALSTFIFYAGLRTWRWYEKTKLFEMRIVEKKEEKD